MHKILDIERGNQLPITFLNKILVLKQEKAIKAKKPQNAYRNSMIEISFWRWVFPFRTSVLFWLFRVKPLWQMKRR